MRTTQNYILILFLLIRFVGYSQSEGYFEDRRDGVAKKGYKTYRWIKIGNQVWMGENLRYYISDSCWSYNNDAELGKKFGYLYHWEASLNACPDGWHLPTDEEWEKLAEFISNQNGGYQKIEDDWLHVGTHLKSTEGWNLYGHGTDDYKFSALPSGYYSISFNYFDNLGESTGWWSSTESSETRAYNRSVSWNENYFYRYGSSKQNAGPVRCICDCDSIPSTTITSINKVKEKIGIDIYPNPNDGKFIMRFQCSRIRKYQIQLINQSGSIQFQWENFFKNNISEKKFVLSNIPKGIYIIKVTDGQTVNTKKIIIQ